MAEKRARPRPRRGRLAWGLQCERLSLPRVGLSTAPREEAARVVTEPTAILGFPSRLPRTENPKEPATAAVDADTDGTTVSTAIDGTTTSEWSAYGASVSLPWNGASSQWNGVFVDGTSSTDAARRRLRVTTAAACPCP